MDIYNEKTVSAIDPKNGTEWWSFGSSTETAKLTPNESAVWQVKEPLQKRRLWEEFLIPEPTSTEILRLAQKYGLLRRARMHEDPLQLDWNPVKAGLWPEAETTSMGTVADLAATESIQADPEITLEDGQRVVRYIDFIETEALWRKELKLLYQISNLYFSLTSTKRPDKRMKAAQDFLPLDGQELSISPLEDILTGILIRKGQLEPAVPNHDDPEVKAVLLKRYYANFHNLMLALEESDLMELVNIISSQKITEVSVRTTISPITGHPEITICPQDLLTGLWLQFIQAMSGQQSIRQCEACGRIFTSLKASKKYCDGRCRARANRAKEKPVN